jgi:hypothetical protein
MCFGGCVERSWSWCGVVVHYSCTSARLTAILLRSLCSPPRLRLLHRLLFVLLPRSLPDEPSVQRGLASDPPGLRTSAPCGRGVYQHRSPLLYLLASLVRQTLYVGFFLRPICSRSAHLCGVGIRCGGSPRAGFTLRLCQSLPSSHRRSHSRGSCWGGYTCGCVCRVACILCLLDPLDLLYGIGCRYFVRIVPRSFPGH